LKRKAELEEKNKNVKRRLHKYILSEKPFDTEGGAYLKNIVLQEVIYNQAAL
jgi:hypothetical protein